MTTKFQHNGVEITLGDNGKFTAVIGGEKVTAPSMDVMKKRIDKAEVFVPFKIISLDTWSKRISSDEVVGIRKARSKYSRDKHTWVTKNRNEPAQVIEDTPENRATLTKLCELQKQHAAIEEEHKAERRALEASIPMRKVPA